MNLKERIELEHLVGYNGMRSNPTVNPELHDTLTRLQHLGYATGQLVFDADEPEANIWEFNATRKGRIALIQS